MKPKVSLCIPTYNCEAYVGETLDSLFGQSFKDVQIKVFDNHSTDQTLECVNKIKNEHPEIEVHTSSVNLGGEGNFNRCIQAGEGEYTAVYHADDVYRPTILEESLKAFENHPEIVAVATHAELIGSQGQPLGERFVPPELRGAEITLLSYQKLLKLSMKYGNFITCPSVMARTSVYKDHIQHWNGQDFKSSADLDVWLRMAKAGPIAFTNKPLIRYRESTASFSFNLFRKRTHRHDLFLVLDHYKKEDSALLNETDQKFYDFLNFKDVALRRLNIMRGFSQQQYPQYPAKLTDLLWCASQSGFHRKFFLLGLGIYALSLFMPSWLRRGLGSLKPSPQSIEQ